MWYHRCTEPCGNSSFNVLRSELTWRPMICCWNWTLTQRAHSNVYNTHLHMAVFPIASSVVLMVFWNSCQQIHSRARYKIDKIRGEEKEGYLKFERPPCRGNHRLKNFMHIFFGMKFWTQGQEAIGWPALCCPGNPDGVQQVKYTKPKRIKAVTPKYCSFPSLKVPLNPFVLTFQIFDLDPEVNQHSSRNRVDLRLSMISWQVANPCFQLRCLGRLVKNAKKVRIPFFLKDILFEKQWFENGQQS